MLYICADFQCSPVGSAVKECERLHILSGAGKYYPDVYKRQLYTYFESATIVMVVYLIMTVVCSRLLRIWERKMDGDANYELVDTMGIGDQLRTSNIEKRAERRKR